MCGSLFDSQLCVDLSGIIQRVERCVGASLFDSQSCVDLSGIIQRVGLERCVAVYLIVSCSSVWYYPASRPRAVCGS